MFCKKCGGEINNDGFCTKCGAPAEQNAAVENVQQPAAVKPKKPVYKKWWFWVLIVLAVIILISIVSGSSDSSDTPATSSVSVNTADKAQKADKNVAGKVGDFIVTVKSSKVTKQYDDNVLIVTYSFTNNSKESKAFLMSIEDKLYQDGVELNDVLTNFDIEDDYSSDNASKEIKPGIQLDVQRAYKLNDTQTDVKVELSRWLFGDDVEQEYTISIK